MQFANDDDDEEIDMSFAGAARTAIQAEVPFKQACQSTYSSNEMPADAWHETIIVKNDCEAHMCETRLCKQNLTVSVRTNWCSNI